MSVCVSTDLTVELANSYVYYSSSPRINLMKQIIIIIIRTVCNRKVHIFIRDPVNNLRRLVSVSTSKRIKRQMPCKVFVLPFVKLLGVILVSASLLQYFSTGTARTVLDLQILRYFPSIFLACGSVLGFRVDSYPGGVRPKIRQPVRRPIRGQPLQTG